MLDVILHIKEDGEATDQDRYIAHYFSKVIEIIEGILKKEEEDVMSFVRVCNRYLEGKSLKYNETNYEVKIRDEFEKDLDLRVLSSGEKQVVSIFSHMYLTGGERYIFIIDEPELSLSVSWQSTLLADIKASGNCSFLAAVTHSPFIFDNKLDKYAVDLRECFVE